MITLSKLATTTGMGALAAAGLRLSESALAGSVSIDTVISSGLIGGAVALVVAAGAAKQKLEQHDRDIRALWDRKVDKESVRPITDSLNAIQEDVRWLVRKNHHPGDTR